MSAEETTFPALLKAVVYEAEGVSAFVFKSLDPKQQFMIEPGAHIDLHLDNGLVRSYSLINHLVQTDQLVVGVQRADEATGRGGSRHVHDALRVGARLTLSLPRNNFSLQEDAAHSVFFAAGIGITPFLSMIERLVSRSASWELHYSAQTGQRLPFRDRLEALQAQSAGRGAVTLYVTRESAGALAATKTERMDLASLVMAAPADTHFYCCGPTPFIDAFLGASASRPPDHRHVEHFSSDVEAANEGGYTIVLQRQGRSIEVGVGQTILDALQANGIRHPSSCRQGLCGTCEVRVLEGVPDHRDMILSDEEKATNDIILICCSGSKSSTLVLDM